MLERVDNLHHVLRPCARKNAVRIRAVRGHGVVKLGERERVGGVDVGLDRTHVHSAARLVVREEREAQRVQIGGQG